jgi:hypothetical protein
MNKTRRDWSVTYSCCRVKRDSLTAFYSLASAIFIISISFYLAVYFFGSKYPEPDTLDEREISRRPGPSTVLNAAGHSSQPTQGTQIRKNLSINDDTDDEILGSSFPIPQNQQLITLDN